MADNIFPVPQNREKAAHINKADYQRLYKQSIEKPDEFWSEQAKRLDWQVFPQIIQNNSFEGDVSIKWFEDGVLNACYNCVDRHLPHRATQTAIIWESDNPAIAKHISYFELYQEICKFANALQKQGVKKGDVVTLYMPMIPEAAIAMLACARIGAIHSVVFGGFSPNALKDRIINCNSAYVITADESVRAGKSVPLKANVDKAIEGLDQVKNVFVVKRTGGKINWNDKRDLWWHDVTAQQPTTHAPEWMSAEDPLFILYTSGSTGQPKGVLHTTGGYLLYAAITHEISFDYKDGEIYWCTADVGWVTGHSYIVYGPLANGATTLMFEGVPSYPDAGRFWDVVEKHKVNIFYTAPTAIRAMLKEGDDYVTRSNRSSLRILGTVGEPINTEAWHWYYDVVGEKRCPIIDTWWQTETGGHLLTPLPGVTDLKPGSAASPFFGIKPIIVDGDGKELNGECEGNLCISGSWPGQMRSIYGDHERFIQTYFTAFKGKYFTGDGAKRDQDGYYWITGRVDDVINVSGHRFGTAEIESAINEHASVAESAVVGFPHELKGQGIYAYIILKGDQEPSESMEKEIVNHVRESIGPIAKIDQIHWTKGLPKTRSGKIMRRILRKIAAGDTDNLGDTSTLADPSVVDELIKSA
jgi:acetyl-CoA synthetase